ncbi:MAG TPA: hypothetical protein VIK14_06725 [Ignavibacteria bacterium]
MNKIEYLALFSDKIYSFNFYYGESKKGIIVSNRDKYYLIEPINIKKYNESPSDIKSLIDEGIIIPVNIETIINWTPIK